MHNDFYVYGHYKLNSSIPFYIGKGRKNRAWHTNNRTKYWHNIVNKYGYQIKLLYKNLSESKAISKEIELIVKYGRKDMGTGILINNTNGGEGLSGYIYSIELKMKRKKDALKQWKNIDFKNKQFQILKNSLKRQEMFNNLDYRKHQAIAQSKKIWPSLRAPNGKIIKEFKNLRQFCRDNKLDHSAMMKVFKKQQKQHKNWSLA